MKPSKRNLQAIAALQVKLAAGPPRLSRYALKTRGVSAPAPTSHTTKGA
jgi:hypothetical protein